MMNLATTAQFRKAVTETAWILGIPLARLDDTFVTWTNYSGNNLRRRTVGYPFAYGVDRKNRVILSAMIEKVLNVQGVTAKTRISKCGYLRGTCEGVRKYVRNYDRY